VPAKKRLELSAEYFGIKGTSHVVKVIILSGKCLFVCIEKVFLFQKKKNVFDEFNIVCAVIHSFFRVHDGIFPDSVYHGWLFHAENTVVYAENLPVELHVLMD
jgi:hypothetical protein